MKASIKRLCNEGTNITTASDVRNPLKERPVKETTKTVNTVNVETKELKLKNIQGSVVIILSVLK